MDLSAIVWLIFGAAMILLETFFAPGIGLFFAGLGAICTAALIIFGFIPHFDTTVHFIYFFVNTTLWAIILWVPLKRWRSTRGGGEYQNIVGDVAVAEGVLDKNAIGKIKWSGTLMKARLDPTDPTAVIEHGQQVKIVSVNGNVAVVRKE